MVENLKLMNKSVCDTFLRNMEIIIKTVVFRVRLRQMRLSVEFCTQVLVGEKHKIFQIKKQGKQIFY